MKRIKIIILSIVFIVILSIIGVTYFKSRWERAQLPKPVQINISNQPMMGNPRARIQFVIFEDLKCSNCARFNNTILPSLKQKYINTGMANYIMINVAFIPGSLPAANAARCIYAQQPELFFPFVDYLYQHQPPENQDWATVPALMNMASRIKGVNVDQLGVCILKNTYNQLIMDNLKQASQIMHNTVQTPSLYVNGIRIHDLNQSEIDKTVNLVK